MCFIMLEVLRSAEKVTARKHVSVKLIWYWKKLVTCLKQLL